MTHPTPRVGMSNQAYKRSLVDDHNEAYLRNKAVKPSPEKAVGDFRDLVDRMPADNLMQHLGMVGDIDIVPDDLPDEIVMALPKPSRVQDQQAIGRSNRDVVVIGGMGVTGAGRAIARSLALTTAREAIGKLTAKHSAYMESAHMADQNPGMFTDTDVIAGYTSAKAPIDVKLNELDVKDIREKMKIGIFTGQGISTVQALADIARLKEKQ